MGKEVLAKEDRFQNAVEKRQAAIKFVDGQFNVTGTVKHLQKLMTEVTKDRVTADTVNAACNCVQNLNLTIKTAIQASRFIMSVPNNVDDE